MIGTTRFLAAALGVALAAPPALAASTDMLSVGDSITEGARSFETGGYRMFLDQMLNNHGVSHTWTGGRYNHAGGAAGRGTFVNGVAINESTGLADPAFDPWNRHYGIGGISANGPTSYTGGDYRTESYSDTRSMLDRFVVASSFDATASHATNLGTIRDPLINAGIGDFQSTVFGTAAGGAVQAPNTVIIGLGTNSLGSGTAASAGAEMHSLLNAYELLQAEGYFPADTRFVVMQIIPRITNSADVISQSVLEQTYDYNELLGDTNSAVYDDLDSSFVDQIEVVDLFRINAADAYNNSSVVRDAAAFEGFADLASFLAAVDVDGDVWVDWSLGIDEADRSSFSGLTDANAELFGFSSSQNDIDRLHPSRLGYSLMAFASLSALLDPTQIIGDLNGDGFVGSEDLEVILAGWGDSVTPYDHSAGDWNGDGLVGQDDLNVVLNNWGDGTPPGGSVPEPGTLASLVLLLLCGGRGRRRSIASPDAA